MENFKLVLPEHLNHLGKLFGGQLLRWVDESAYIAARMEYPGCNFVTIGLSQVEFRQQVVAGAVLRFVVTKVKQGNTSVCYEVDVNEIDDCHAKSVFATTVTFVNIGPDGNKVPVV
ncbi:acyl-CoA thioesterase [Sulfuriroseicoccus oceanibius]|uniref:Acyl-CoA thioesterase n=1 Tax=Sulfuriroseicoccus oceanibius TaxID=2707525 RepID=A0A6B3LB32_9BACT|nr:hotdog domain-containing protein [Sulfuriroseicoccus oceanibius]QQL44000.1 acyl-CoA thioesterase [Sulfuriroseicoccus oceanibius]